MKIPLAELSRRVSMVRFSGLCGCRIFAALLLSSLVGLCGVYSVSGFSQEEAYDSVQLAEEAVASAFQTVLDAEGAGANVSGLIVRLNEAAGLLAASKLLLNNGDVSGALVTADSSVEMADTVKTEALGLKASALAHRDYIFKVTLAGSSVAVSAFLMFMFFLWRWFKAHYLRRLFGLQPEVVPDVES